MVIDVLSFRYKRNARLSGVPVQTKTCQNIIPVSEGHGHRSTNQVRRTP